MKWFKNMRIRRKMLLSFFLVVALMVALSVFAIIQTNEVDRQNTYAFDFPGSRETAILKLQVNVLNLRRLVVTETMYAPLDDDAKIEPLVAEITTTYAACRDALVAYEELVKNDTVFTQADINQRLAKSDSIRKTLETYKTEVCDVVEAAALAGNYETALGAVAKAADIINEIWSTVEDLAASAVTSENDASMAATATAGRATVYIIVIASVATVLAAAISLYVAALLSRPLKTLSAFMKKAGATGNITLGRAETELIDNYGKCKDEIGQTISGAASFISHVSTIAGELETVAGGDLTSEFSLLSDDDTMGISLKQMVENLNRMFSEIQTSTLEVSTGSKQVADGAQALAQGSTEQASSIQELSSSIAIIAEKTKDNARTADKTAKLSSQIRESAEKGSRQMGDMISAVKEINEASESISKIIKTIDEIAFQTNILALNAAVEAARAGQHGKGFAVVAEEVRNLASKSAEAAKDTSLMIQNSVEKSELGARIAQETAASLTEIVTGISESAQLVGKIAEASEQQSLGISQINIGIDQVAQVVQQNSATAEESAAASEEMSGQSDVLQQLISQFKLRESGMFRSLVPAEKPARKKLGLPQRSSLSKYEI